MKSNDAGLIRFKPEFEKNWPKIAHNCPEKLDIAEREITIDSGTTNRS